MDSEPCIDLTSQASCMLLLAPCSTSLSLYLRQRSMQEDDAEQASDWETASDDSEKEMDSVDLASHDPWDVRRSFFDSKVSSSMEANLQHMWENFGFYLPDSEYLEDPEGLLQYLVNDSFPVHPLRANPRLQAIHTVY